MKYKSVLCLDLGSYPEDNLLCTCKYYKIPLSESPKSQILFIPSILAEEY